MLYQKWFSRCLIPNFTVSASSLLWFSCLPRKYRISGRIYFFCIVLNTVSLKVIKVSVSEFCGSASSGLWFYGLPRNFRILREFLILGFFLIMVFTFIMFFPITTDKPHLPEENIFFLFKIQFQQFFHRFCYRISWFLSFRGNSLPKYRLNLEFTRNTYTVKSE